MSRLTKRCASIAAFATAQLVAAASFAQTCPPGTPPGNLCWLGGRVVHNPKLYLVYWGWGSPINDPNNFVPIIDTFTRGIGGTRGIAMNTQYYDNYLPGNFYIPNPTDL